MTLTQKFDTGQAAAPSYCIVESDGEPYTCSECKIRDKQQFVKYWTPDGVYHKITHLACIDPEWLKIAKKMDFTI